MPVLIILAILAIYGIIHLIDVLTPSAKAHDKKTLDEISSRMIGKSQSECRKILKEYRKK